MENFLNEVLKENQIESNKIVDTTISKLIDNAKVFEISKSIKDLKLQILQIFNMYKEKEEFREMQISIPNANVKKDYFYQFDLGQFPNIKISDIKNLNAVGLEFDSEKQCIFGIPTTANQIDIHIEFFSINDENLSIDIKTIPFIVNADPKDLWLNKPSPKDSRFPKEDNVTFSSQFLDKKIVIASKRGRSHAHEGTFRDDDFTVKELPDNWTIVAVADGAGSARFARAGSQMATEIIAKNFSSNDLMVSISQEVQNFYARTNNINIENQAQEETNIVDENSLLDSEVPQDNTNEVAAEKEQKLKSKRFIINAMYNEVKKLHLELESFALAEGFTLKDINSTLIFALVKKFEFGYVMLTFGVGDCPINVISEDNNEIKLLNFLDVGEFGGGTRFITMPEIFGRPDMVNRFGINLFGDFSKLFLMTDGIYDPKFVVESKLENMESWNEFLNDLNGQNEDGIIVDFENDSEIEMQLSNWMDFWSKGNHDDRTLAIIY
ncbi:PP2C family serine/threonine-protein phosphatase [Chryseobacterium sp. T1]